MQRVTEQKKETIITCIQKISSKDISAFLPISLRVNLNKVLNVLRWLTKLNNFYHSIQIVEENLDLMNENIR